MLMPGMEVPVPVAQGKTNTTMIIVAERLSSFTVFTSLRVFRYTIGVSPFPLLHTTTVYK